MIRGTERWLDSLANHYIVLSVFLAQIILTALGVGNPLQVSVLGILLCATGFVQCSAQVDIWVLLPLIIYNLASMVSSFAVYGNIADGYGEIQLLFPVLYLLMACAAEEEVRFLRRLCVLWSGIVAAEGVIQFAFLAAFQHRASRLSGMLGNPNALGIFLVAGWFLLIDCVSTGEGHWRDKLLCLEPVLLVSIALTLSLGSFAAMAVGVLVLLWQQARTSGCKTLLYACRLLSRASLGMGTGVLLYLSSARTGVPWICLFFLGYTAALVCCWRRFWDFLEACPKMAAIIAGLGVLVAATAVAVRSSSWATFTERLAMLRNGFRYLTQSPLFGVGPFQWRLLNLRDSDLYFNTWHIHNALLHVGVELGWIAMTALAVVPIRFFRKKASGPIKAGFAAFCLHNMMDASFFYLGITSLVLIAAGNPHLGGKKLGVLWLRLIFGLSAAVFAFGLLHAVLGGGV